MNKFTLHLLRNISFLFTGLLLSISLFAQEIMLNPTSTVYQIHTDIPEYICPDFDIVLS